MVINLINDMNNNLLDWFILENGRGIFGYDSPRGLIPFFPQPGYRTWTVKIFEDIHLMSTNFCGSEYHYYPYWGVHKLEDRRAKSFLLFNCKDDYDTYNVPQYAFFLSDWIYESTSLGHVAPLGHRKHPKPIVLYFVANIYSDLISNILENVDILIRSGVKFVPPSIKKNYHSELRMTYCDSNIEWQAAFYQNVSCPDLSEHIDNLFDLLCTLKHNDIRKIIPESNVVIYYGESLWDIYKELKK